jgi:GntR family transcriptional regulator
MRDRIDHQSAVPLYHQVAEAVRYRIATGELAPGRRLPSLRQAADLWGVNLHTVRRAYAELAEHGILASRSRSGTVVLNGGAARAQEANGLDAFLHGVLRQGAERWGLSAPKSGMLRNAGRPALASTPGPTQRPIMSEDGRVSPPGGMNEMDYRATGPR